MDIILKPLAQEVKSYIRDTPHFLAQIPKNVEDDDLLVTCDVKSLYSNIPHDLGLTAVGYWYDLNSHLLPRHFSKELIIEGVQLVLENNTFNFANQTFIQHKGTAMGTKLAPTYATLVLGYLEQQMYDKTDEVLGHEAGEYVRNNWMRFLDDCFTVWKRRFGTLDNFCRILNQLHPDLEFVMENSTIQLPFLDVMVIKEGTSITTDLFQKATDTRRYLPYNSCHPGHTRKNIPYCLARRVAMIVSD